MLNLPLGYSARPTTLADVKAATDLLNICAVQLTGKPEHTPDQVETDWQLPSLNLAEDTCLIQSSDGETVGLAVFQNRTPHVRLWASADVHPLHRGKGLGTALASWIEQRARQAMLAAPPDAKVVLVQERLSNDTTAHALLTAQGYALARHSLRMERDLAQGQVDPPRLPADIAIRTMRPEQEEPNVVAVICEAFKDHWGWVERPFEDELAEWNHYLATAPDADPSLWFVAVQETQIIATCLCHPTMAEDTSMAFVFGLSVLRDWRRKGIALALLQTVFQELAQRGKRRVGLQVDAENLTGATQLYQKAGMQMVRQDDTFVKTLRSGQDLTTRGGS